MTKDRAEKLKIGNRLIMVKDYFEDLKTGDVIIITKCESERGLFSFKSDSSRKHINHNLLKQYSTYYDLVPDKILNCPEYLKND